MRTPLGLSISLAIMLLLDTYIFQVVKAVSQSASPKARTIIYSVYWGITALAILSFLLFVYTDQNFLGKKVRTYLFATVIGLSMAKMVAVIFFWWMMCEGAFNGLPENYSSTIPMWMA